MPKYAGPGFAAIVYLRACGYWLDVLDGARYERCMRFSLSSGWRRRTLTVAAAGALALSGIVLSATAGSAAPTASAAAGRGPDGLGIQPGKIKHVWLIILENKSYDATFTGLNNNTYLWKTLPVAGRRC